MLLWSSRYICSCFQKHPVGCGCGSGLRGHADEIVYFCLCVNGVLRTFCLFSAPLCPVTQARGPRRSTSAGFRQRWPLAPLPWGDSRVWLQKIMAGKENFQGRQLQIGISFASSAQVWLSQILPDVSHSQNATLLQSLNSQHGLATFAAGVINLFKI